MKQDPQSHSWNCSKLHSLKGLDEVSVAAFVAIALLEALDAVVFDVANPALGLPNAEERHVQ